MMARDLIQYDFSCTLWAGNPCSYQREAVQIHCLSEHSSLCFPYLSAQLRTSEEFIHRRSSPPRMRRVVAVLLLVRVDWMQGVASLTKDIPFLNLTR